MLRLSISSVLLCICVHVSVAHIQIKWQVMRLTMSSTSPADDDVWYLRFMCAYHIRPRFQSVHKSIVSSISPRLTENSSISKYGDGKFHPKLELIFAFVIIFVFNRFGLLELIELKIIIINEMNNIIYTYIVQVQRNEVPFFIEETLQSAQRVIGTQFRMWHRCFMEDCDQTTSTGAHMDWAKMIYAHKFIISSHG